MCKCHHRISILRYIGAEGTCLVSHIICSDGDVVLLKGCQQSRVVADDTGGNHLCTLPVTDWKLLKLSI